MKTPVASLGELLNAADSGVIDFQFLQRLANEGSVDHAMLLNQLADHIARSYYAGSMTFEAADRAMNAAFSVSVTEEYWASNERVVPEPMYTVFQAFDAGEYVHHGDAPDEDPEAKYTRPLIYEYLLSAKNDA